MKAISSASCRLSKRSKLPVKEVSIWLRSHLMLIRQSAKSRITENSSTKEKQERAAKKHQKVITVKEVKFRINVDEHDYQTKKNHVLRFLDDGDKVKATIFFRGREMAHTNLGRVVLERLLTDVKDKAIVEFRP